MSFQASISRRVQAKWLDAGNVFGLDHDDNDFAFGGSAGTGRMTIQGAPPFCLAPQEVFVETNGCEDLLVPQMTALAALAAGKTG